MMWKYKIKPSGVNLYRLSQMFNDPGAALSVPTRPSWPPWRIPSRLSSLGRLPKGKVQRELSAGEVFDTRLIDLLIEVRSMARKEKVFAIADQVRKL